MANAASQIQIREIKEISELKAVEGLQKEIWGCSDLEVLSSLALIPLLEIGGVLFGAFDADQLIGFVLGLPGFADGRLVLHSDMLAVKSEYRSRGLGYKLKLAQRERALAKGIDRITWTFDPLQSRNAHLNFAKLGVIADRYRINYYGETSSFLHQTGTDRLWVTWLLGSERVKRRLQAPTATVLSRELDQIPALLLVSENMEPIIKDNLPSELGAIVEIPADINVLLSESIELAIRWREATRQVFTRLLGRGYRVEEFNIGTKGKNTAAYILRAGPGSMS